MQNLTENEKQARKLLTTPLYNDLLKLYISNFSAVQYATAKMEFVRLYNKLNGQGDNLFFEFRQHLGNTLQDNINMGN